MTMQIRIQNNQWEKMMGMGIGVLIISGINYLYILKAT